MNAEDKPRYDHAVALPIAQAIRALLSPCCVRIEIAGSLRRGRPTVGDIELVYVPRFGPQPAGLELLPDERTTCNLADACIAGLETAGMLERRKNSKGQTTFGPVNKFMRHVESGIPIDLFATSEACWHNYLVCRTGGVDTNFSIAVAAQARGWKWTPYGPGFSHPSGLFHPVTSERDVFDYVGLPYSEPVDRA
jgi:DNA polymerase/3'-5' exonuclease PolX